MTRLRQCTTCALVQICAHAYLFETPPPPHARKMRQYPAVPHPFVLNPLSGMENLPAGVEYALDLTLIGRGNRHLPYLVHALERAARAGRGRGVMALSSVEHEARTGTDDWFRVHVNGGRSKIGRSRYVRFPPPRPLRSVESWSRRCAYAATANPCDRRHGSSTACCLTCCGGSRC